MVCGQCFAKGAGQLEQKYLPHGQRHVFVDLPVSKTRAKRAAAAGEVATSRWQALVEPLREKISMVAPWKRLAGFSTTPKKVDRRVGNLEIMWKNHQTTTYQERVFYLFAG